MTFLSSESRRIVAAAIRVGAVVISVPRPGRHGTIFAALSAAGVVYEIGSEEQGFLTSDGLFVDRFDACRIADAAGQIVRKTGSADELYSEDLW